MEPLPRIALVLLAWVEFAALPTVAFGQEAPKIQAGGGYLTTYDLSAAFASPVFADRGHGWFFKLVGNVTPHFGAIAEVSGSYDDAFYHRGLPGSARVYSALGGALVRPFCCAFVVPFGHVLAGTLRSRFTGTGPRVDASSPDISEGHFVMAFGGGADVRGFHVATDLMRLQQHDDFSAWTWRVAVGVMLPGK